MTHQAGGVHLSRVGGVVVRGIRLNARSCSFECIRTHRQSYMDQFISLKGHGCFRVFHSSSTSVL